MPRKLPWLADGAGIKKSKGKERALDVLPVSVPRKRHSSELEDEDEDTVDELLDEITKTPVTSRIANVDFSSPINAPAPPTEELMREGYHADDGWRMVEDEFFSTARLFTAHLHAAEYKRLSKLAKGRKGQEIDRAVDSRAEQSNMSKITSKAKARRQQMSDLLAKDNAGDGDEVDLEAMEDAFMKDSKLAALMGGMSKMPRMDSAIVREPVSQDLPFRDSQSEDLDLDLDHPLLRKKNVSRSGSDVKRERSPSNSDSTRTPSLSPRKRSPLRPLPSKSTKEQSPPMWIGIGRTANAQERAKKPPAVQRCRRSPSPARGRSSSPVSRRPNKPTRERSPLAEIDELWDDDLDKAAPRKDMAPRLAARLAKLRKNNTSNKKSSVEDLTKEDDSTVVPTFLF